MEKKIFLFASILGILALSSCSNEETTMSEEPVCKLPVSHQSVADLTLKLKEYDSQFPQRKRPLFEKSGKKTKLTFLDWLKVGIADVSGALSGTTIGGWGGAAVGAVVASINKYVEILDAKNKEKEKKDLQLEPTIVSNSTIPTFLDSLGYYHNISEEMLYDKYGNNIKSTSPKTLVRDTHAYLKKISTGYYSKKPTFQQLDLISRAMYRIKNVRDSSSDSFFDYCNNLKRSSLRDSSYIDFSAEYLYTCVCSNVDDIRSYTLEVLRQIDSSNAESDDKNILTQCVLIAYSSLLYSAQMECVDIE